MIAEGRMPPHAGAGQQAASDPGRSNGAPHDTEAAVSIQAAVAELLAAGATYLAAKRDLIQLRLRSLLIGLVISFLALVAAVSVIATTAVLLVTGAAGGLSAAFDVPWWAGHLIASGTAIAIATVSIYVALISLRHSSFTKTVARYEHQHKPETSGVHSPTAAPHA